MLTSVTPRSSELWNISNIHNLTLKHWRMMWLSYPSAPSTTSLLFGLTGCYQCVCLPHTTHNSTGWVTMAQCQALACLTSRAGTCPPPCSTPPCPSSPCLSARVLTVDVLPSLRHRCVQGRVAEMPVLGIVVALSSFRTGGDTIWQGWSALGWVVHELSTQVSTLG